MQSLLPVFPYKFSKVLTYLSTWNRLQSRHNKWYSKAFIDILPTEQHEVRIYHLHDEHYLALNSRSCRGLSIFDSWKSYTNVLPQIDLVFVPHCEIIELLHNFTTSDGRGCNGDHWLSWYTYSSIFQFQSFTTETKKQDIHIIVFQNASVWWNRLMYYRS